MFRRLMKWLRSSFKPESSSNVYKPRERLIYQYFDGEKDIRADPMILYRKIMDKGPELLVDMKVSESASQDANKAYVESVRKIREIFSVKPLEEGGLTETECFMLLEHCLDFVATVKKNLST